MVVSSNHAEFPVLYGLPSNVLVHKRSSSLDYVPDESEYGDLEDEASDMEGEDSDEEDEEDPRFTLKSYQDNFSKMGQVLNIAGEDATPNQQEEFKNRYEEYLRPHDHDQGHAAEQKNFLYRIARDGPTLPWLVGHLVERYPELLDQRDAAGTNALFLAIASKQIKFIRSVLASNINKDKFGTVLTASGKLGNCIHQAIINNLDSKVTVQLIEAASEEALRTRDGKGLTPLHHAVDYIRCNESGFPVIQALIRHGNQAFDEVTKPPGSFSPYQYHLETRRKYEKDLGRKKSNHASVQRNYHASVQPGTVPRKDPEQRQKESRVGLDMDGPRRTNSMALDEEKEPNRFSRKAPGQVGEQSSADLVMTAAKRTNIMALELNGFSRKAPSQGQKKTSMDFDMERDRTTNGMALKSERVSIRKPHIAADDIQTDWERVNPGKPTSDSGPKITMNGLSPDAIEQSRFGGTEARVPGVKRVLTARSITEEDSGSANVRESIGMKPDVADSTRSLALPDAQRSTKKTGESLPLTDKKTPRKKIPKGSSTSQPSPDIAESVAKALKLHYLRTVFERATEHGEDHESESGGPGRTVMAPRAHDSAIKFLYADNKDDKHICFEFPPGAQDQAVKIAFGDFESSYDAFSFDEVLLYVDFGLIELPPPARRRNGPDTGAGRKDMVTFFNWLGKKGVTNIIKVIVEDRKGTPHSDEAIIAALENFNVEILDWRKIDLDPKAIQEACVNSAIRELHLWWSGNNAMLRAWSEPGGIVQLPNLERVHIHQVQGALESPNRVTKNLEEFDNRLQSGRRSIADVHTDSVAPTQRDLQKKPDFKPIEVTHSRLGDLLQQRHGALAREKHSQGRSSLDTHRWLSIIDDFAQGIQSLPPPPVSSFMPEPMSFEECLNYKDMPDELKKEVRVALIDDGADLMHKPISNILEKKGRSFDIAYDDPDHSGGPRPFHGSTTGHGTCMAYMIGRVCPKVKIFVIKLDVIRGSKGQKAGFTAKSAADAVEFAVERGFDIVSMSWTVQKNVDLDNDNLPDIQRLENALKLAVQKNMLLFCSAPDIGEASRELLGLYYPFGCSGVSDGIFRIGAAKADGSMYGWSGRGDSVDFILPGHNVEVREEDKISEEPDAPLTGSSVATALAAGLAALIIHCVRLGAVYNWCNGNDDQANAVNKDTLVAIRRLDCMKAAFRSISNGDKDCRVEVDGLFRDPGAVLNKAHAKDDAKTKWNMITQLARDLVSSQRQGSVSAGKSFGAGR